VVVAAAGLVGLADWLGPRVGVRRESPPTAAEVRARWVSSDALVLDREGRALNAVRVDHDGRRLEWTPLEEVSPALRSAVIASEDRRYESHAGVDVYALLGVIGRTVLGDSPRGASTITMQVAAMIDGALQRHGGPRTLWQKWRQMRWAWALERRWTKGEILETYLNLVSFRGELQGVAAASRLVFGKAPNGVTGAEAMVLAALVRAPNAGTDAVIRRAFRLRAATGAAVADDEIIEATAQLTRTRTGADPAPLAPHLARRLLKPDRGHCGPPASRCDGAPPSGDDATGARTVSSTIDTATQRVATQALRQHLLALDGKRVRDGAVLVVENATGDVRAYVGGSGALSSGPYVDAVSARRQAGSTLKPFLYALAFERRLLTPASLIDDRPLDVPVFGGLYRPENYDRQFSGAVSARTALAASLNIPAVRVLAVVGADSFVAQLRDLGFAGLNRSGAYYGPALALGAADVSLEELVNAYRTLANHGRRSSLHFFRETTTPSESPPRGGGDERGGVTRVYSSAAAFLTSAILADRESRSATFGLESPLSTRFWSAVKTGTSKSMRDNWCIGYSQRFTVGVWVGNLSGEPMRGVSGMSGAAPIWVEVMEWLHRGEESRPPSVPAGVVAAASAERAEWFLAGTEPLVTRIQPVQARERITAPAAGSVIAIDPDIPPTRQRVLLQADGVTGRSRWQLDGTDLGAATATTLWIPGAGTHQLALVTADGVVLDRVRFTVRGAQ
jgi:penicillin-binding protein 1C